ncbi:helix-turn-helix domain-containing protein [Fundicoccus culcitae]|uniref:Helix-turn-helix domain-containing protein n=1 Tax=Fundicoccus culcitae TaxID=2969821 RepID=A0ABY5P596_9LACT|nr:helix-turn-helix domain-containing protein [Fundicoccus culcitae]UUX33922.1 helix-turn-helix domain-containing protein [Fundicoccus culcitae]
MNSDKYIKYLQQYAGKYIVSDEAADFIFVFNGHVQIKTKDFQQPFDKGEFFIANKGEEVIFTHPSTDSLICLIRIDESLIKNEINIVGFHFLCNSVIQTTIDHTKTKNIVFNLIASEINEDNSIRKKGLYLTFLDSLMSKYLIKNASIQTKDDRMNDILDYIDAYYYRDLSLHQISKNFYMSSSYFSRYFVQETGKNYNKYLKEIRLNKSLELLSNSSEPITQIALQVGFSSAGTFNKSFKEKFHITPTEYRLKSREVVKVPDDFEIGKNLQMSNNLPNDDSFSDLNEDLNEELKKDSNIIEVSLIANQNDKIDFDSNHYMNIGSIDNLIDGTFQSHLKILGCLAGGISALIVAILNVKAYALGTGILGFFSLISPEGIGNDFWFGILVSIISFVLALVGTYLFGWSKEADLKFES